ncbi:unnamed protein product, partial [marine sediment metagenome]
MVIAYVVYEGFAQAVNDQARLMSGINPDRLP